MTAEIVLTPVTPRGRALRFAKMGPDELNGGVGGWESLPRPRRRAATAWVGTPEATFVIPLMLDGMETTRGRDRVVEPDCRLLESWGLAHPKTKEPVVLRISGPTLATTRSRWVIQEIAWEEPIRNAAGRRVQQQVVVTLLQHLAPTLVKSPAKRARRRLMAERYTGGGIESAERWDP